MSIAPIVVIAIQCRGSQVVVKPCARLCMFLNSLSLTCTSQVRMSPMQAHVAPVASKDDVRAMVAVLLLNGKIARATHNMWAFRIRIPDKGAFLQDCDDDGEAAAGSRLLHLLQVRSPSRRACLYVVLQHSPCFPPRTGAAAAECDPISCSRCINRIRTARSGHLAAAHAQPRQKATGASLRTASTPILNSDTSATQQRRTHGALCPV